MSIKFTASDQHYHQQLTKVNNHLPLKLNPTTKSQQSPPLPSLRHHRILNFYKYSHEKKKKTHSIRTTLTHSKIRHLTLKNHTHTKKKKKKNISAALIWTQRQQINNNKRQDKERVTYPFVEKKNREWDEHKDRDEASI